MKPNKIVLILLAIVLLLGTAACAKTESPDESQAPTEKTTESTQQAEATAAPESQYPEYLNLDSDLPIVKEGEEITLSITVKQDDSTGGDAEDIWFWAWAEQYMNINFDVQQVLGSALGEKKNLMFASGDLTDVLLGLGMTTTEIVAYGQNEGQLLGLNDYLTEEYAPNILKWFDYLPVAKAMSTCPDGVLYTLPRIDSDKNTASAGGQMRVFINDEWLDAVGMNSPETLEDFVAVLRAFKEQDPAGVGSENVIPLGGGANPPDELYTAVDPRAYILNSLGFLTVKSTATEPAIRNGEAVIPAADPLYKEYLSIMNTLYTEGLISQDFFTIDDTQVRAQNAEGLIGVIAEWPFLSLPDDFKGWSAVNPLTSEWSDTKQWENSNRFRIGGFSISAACECPEVAVRFGDYFFTDYGYLAMWGGPMAGTEETLDMVGGWYYDEEKDTMAFIDVENGTFENAYTYLMGAQAPCFPGVGNFTSYSFDHQEEGYLYQYEYAGIEGRQKLYNDMDNPDHYHRVSIIENIVPYLKDGYPSIVYFTEEESTKISDLKTVIRDYVATETAKFITGARSLDEFDAYLAELEKLGISDYAKYYVDAYADYMAAQG